jgi:hypothetical protein
LADARRAAACGQPAVVTIPNKNPIVTFRMVFRPGLPSDPKGQEGAAAMVASMLSEGGTRELTYQQIVVNCSRWRARFRRRWIRR